MRRCIGDRLTLRPREGDLEAREKGTSAVLCTNTLGTSDEVYVHTEGGRIRVIVDLDLREETKGGWRETEGYHAGSGMGLVKAVGGTLEGDALKVTKAREDELAERLPAVPARKVEDTRLSSQEKARESSIRPSEEVESDGIVRAEKEGLMSAS